MKTTPQEACEAVKRVLAEVSREHEAAYTVISQAVRICVSSGMSRKETARFLDIPGRRIDKRGQYFRSLLATRDLFLSAFASRKSPSHEEAVSDIIQRAWNSKAPHF